MFTPSPIAQPFPYARTPSMLRFAVAATPRPGKRALRRSLRTQLTRDTAFTNLSTVTMGGVSASFAFVVPVLKRDHRLHRAVPCDARVRVRLARINGVDEPHISPRIGQRSSPALLDLAELVDRSMVVLRRRDQEL